MGLVTGLASPPAPPFRAAPEGREDVHSASAPPPATFLMVKEETTLTEDPLRWCFRRKPQFNSIKEEESRLREMQREKELSARRGIFFDQGFCVLVGSLNLRSSVSHPCGLEQILSPSTCFPTYRLRQAFTPLRVPPPIKPQSCNK